MTAMMRPFSPPHLPQTRAPSQRLAGTLAVGALHVLIIAGLLQATFVSVPRQRLRREIEIWFLFPPKQNEMKPRKTKVQQSIPVQSLAVPDYRHIVLPPPATETGNVNGALFDCDPDHEAMMTAEEKERCARANLLRHDNGAVDYADHLDLSSSAALWEQRRRRRNTPLLLPCADPHASAHMLHIDLLCAARVVLGNTNPDAQAAYDTGR